jgi:hypothetical protein
MVLWAGQVTAKEPDEFDVEIRNSQEALEIVLKGQILNHSLNENKRMETRIIYKGRYWICEDIASFLVPALQLNCISLNN